LVPLVHAESVVEMDLRDPLVCAVLTVPWDLLASLVVLVNLVHQDSPVHLGLRETWADLETREALVYKDPEENLANLVFLARMVKWDLQERMEAMERRVDLVPLELQDHLDSLDQEVSPV